MNVARSPDEAEKQARGERITAEAEEEPEAEFDPATMFEPGAEQPEV